MAIPITGAGSLFVRLGHLWGAALDVLAARGSAVTPPDYALTIPSKVIGNVIPDYAAGTADYAIISGQTTPRGVTGVNVLGALQSWQQAQGEFLTSIQQIAQATLVDMAAASQALPQNTLQAAMLALINQISDSGGSQFHITASTVAAGAQANGIPAPSAPFAASGNSGPIVVASVKGGRGFNLDNVLAEKVLFACTRDAQSGGATKFSESIQAAGSLSQPDVFSPYWPLGSGASATLTAVNAALNNSGGNLLQNGEFAAFTTANVPDNWTVATGLAGTQVLSSATGYQDSSCVEFVGDAGTSATLTALTQSFNTAPSTTVGAGGTSANLLTLPDRPFAGNLWYKLSGSPAAGVLAVELVDGSGTVINDDAAVANTKSVTLSGVGNTNWNVLNAAFRLPAVDPTGPVKLRIRLSTALSTGTNLFIDRVGFTQMTQFYGNSTPAGVGGGPFLAVFSGNLAPLVGDFWTVAFTNTWGNWAQAFYRLFRMDQLGLRLPTAGGTLIDDTVGGSGLIS